MKSDWPASGRTHDHGLQVEAAIVEWSCSDRFERLFTGLGDLVKELITEVVLHRIRCTLRVTNEVFDGRELSNVECQVVAKEVQWCSYIERACTHFAFDATLFPRSLFCSQET